MERYDPSDYSQLPDLFDIEAVLSTNRNNITLFINGTSRSNNVTVICADFTNFLSGQFDPLFTLLLEFVSKFTNQVICCVIPPEKNDNIGILPAPTNHVQYSDQSPTGQLQIIWEPPTLLSNELELNNLQIRVDPRIIHYIIYIIMEESTVVSYNTSGTSFTIEPGNVFVVYHFR